MTTVQGYYNGNVIVALEKLNAAVNQKVKITLLDEYVDAQEQRKIALKHFKGIAKGAFSGIDPVEYQKKLRTERNDI